ncbi:glutathione S-transferase U8-like [Alnus glutinosa]|uniref:glutathione S-transferase U8-like n=1 Tax=Alnus glutinosa TaxID=3517 RepID=UPI002D783C0C|nr:glutathione S-transferase U8-like [Alnus glutinosa]
MADEVVLFGIWGSPFSRRVEIALQLKGVEYKYIEEDLANKSPSLLQYNPIHKKVPVLVHSGKPIVESQVILEYIDETWQGYPILPKDPYERAVARFWAKFIDEKCLPEILKACWGEKKEHEKAVKEVDELLKVLENEVKEKRFFGGQSIGMVDIVANIIGFWRRACEEGSGVELLTREKFPKLRNWIDKFVSSSVIKKNLPPRDKLVVFLRDCFGSANASK